MRFGVEHGDSDPEGDLERGVGDATRRRLPKLTDAALLYLDSHLWSNFPLAAELNLTPEPSPGEIILIDDLRLPATRGTGTTSTTVTLWRSRRSTRCGPDSDLGAGDRTATALHVTMGTSAPGASRKREPANSTPRSRR